MMNDTIAARLNAPCSTVIPGLYRHVRTGALIEVRPCSAPNHTRVWIQRWIGSLFRKALGLVASMDDMGSYLVRIMIRRIDG